MEFFDSVLHSRLFIPFTYFASSVQRIWLPYLVTSYLLAFFLEAVEMRRVRNEALRSGLPVPKQESLFQKVFPKKMFTHRSAIVDYFYFYSNTLLYAFITAPSIFSLSKFSFLAFHFLENCFGQSEAMGPVTFQTRAIYALVLILAMDLGLFLAHWVQHVSPFLWNFHKVHHSAEVLTPITVYRMHPIDDMLNYLVSGMLVGITEACFRYFVSFQVSGLFAGGLNIFLFLFYVAFYNLRHSHIWCSYGPFWSKIFISPAQHQIHHSTARRHWDKNYGFIFAIWDWAFGSLYVPKGREVIEFGVGDGSEAQYSNFIMLYWIPFRDASRMLAKRLLGRGGKSAGIKSEAKPESASRSD